MYTCIHVCVIGVYVCVYVCMLDMVVCVCMYRHVYVVACTYTNVHVFPCARAHVCVRNCFTCVHVYASMDISTTGSSVFIVCQLHMSCDKEQFNVDHSDMADWSIVVCVCVECHELLV